MGDYTTLDCEFILKDEDIAKFKQLHYIYYARHPVHKEHKMIHMHKELEESLKIYNHEFINDERADYVISEFDNIDNNKLKFKINIKNYSDTYKKFFDFLQSIDAEIIKYDTWFVYDEEWIDDYTCYRRWRNWLTEEKFLTDDDDDEI